MSHNGSLEKSGYLHACLIKNKKQGNAVSQRSENEFVRKYCERDWKNNDMHATPKILERTLEKSKNIGV
jgi:hypothetical protein